MFFMDLIPQKIYSGKSFKTRPRDLFSWRTIKTRLWMKRRMEKVIDLLSIEQSQRKLCSVLCSRMQKRSKKSFVSFHFTDTTWRLSLVFFPNIVEWWMPRHPEIPKTPRICCSFFKSSLRLLRLSFRLELVFIFLLLSEVF